MSDVASIQRQLKIKTGVVNRLYKEHKSYIKEQEDQEKKNVKLAESEESDDKEWNIKNGNKMLEEAKKVVKDTSDRLGKATLELRDLVVASKSDPELEKTEEFIKAEEALENVSV